MAKGSTDRLGQGLAPSMMNSRGRRVEPALNEIVDERLDGGVLRSTGRADVCRVTYRANLSVATLISISFIGRASPRQPMPPRELSRRHTARKHEMDQQVRNLPDAIESGSAASGNE
jgi:hypothetical protein